jgi:hypothetical protein
MSVAPEARTDWRETALHNPNVQWSNAVVIALLDALDETEDERLAMERERNHAVVRAERAESALARVEAGTVVSDS